MMRPLIITYRITTKQISNFVRTEKDGRVRQRLMAMKFISLGQVPWFFVPTARYDHIQNVLRPKSKWTLEDARLKIVNNFKKSFDKILLKAGIKTGTFHDIRRTVISMWFANGIGEYEIMRLASKTVRFGTLLF